MRIFLADTILSPLVVWSTVSSPPAVVTEYMVYCIVPLAMSIVQHAPCPSSSLSQATSFHSYSNIYSLVPLYHPIAKQLRKKNLKNRYSLGIWSFFFFTSGNFIKIWYLHTTLCQMCEKKKVWKVWPIYDPLYCCSLEKMPEELLSSQAEKPMYEPQHPPPPWR
jgi:hypothetical protein